MKRDLTICGCRRAILSAYSETCLEAEILTDVQHRLALLSRDMKILHQPALSRSLPDREPHKQNRP